MDVLKNKYHIRRAPGRGGTATVYLAQDLGNGNEVVCKILHL
jgi:hypothetical protein